MNTESIDTSKLETLTLTKGAHQSREAGMCAMEAVAWLAGEPHSDAPACACPVIARVVISLNDEIGSGADADALRNEILKPMLPKIVGSRVPWPVMVKRAFAAADMAVREYAPAALESAKQPELAKEMRELAPVVDRATALAANEKSKSVRERAWKNYRAAAADAAAYAAAYAAAAADAAYAAAAYAAAAYAAAAAAAAYAAAARRVARYRARAEVIKRLLEVTA